jgi:UPF0755 protein
MRAAVGAALLFAGLLFLLYGRMPAIGEEASHRVLYEVPENMPAAVLVQDLHDKNLIAFPEVLTLVFRVTGWEKRIRAGYYYLPSRNSVMGIARKLTSGQMATRVVTLPEGLTSWEIFAILKRSFPSLDLETFESLVESPEFARSLGVDAPTLEGYLFPDTYAVPFKLSERDILTLMVARFHEVTAELDKDSYIVEKHGLHGWVTLASIVEKEAAVNREQRRIAGVFTNRLKQGWSLGADPTVRFALRKLTGPLRSADLNISSPYNTRRFRGLPPGPVCSPGESALRATLNPEKTRMMFFVAKDDGSREHFFSVTYAEHNRLKEQAAINRELYRERLQRQEDSLALLAVTPPDKTAPDPDATELAPAHALKEPKIGEAAHPDSAPRKRPAIDSVRKKAAADSVRKKAAADSAKKKTAADTVKKKAIRQ